jgi:polyisoprenoid-binding protein YceI
MDEVSKSDRREIDQVMFDEVLEKDKYPQAEYKSSRVQVSGNSKNTYRVDGDLKLHGFTRSMELNAQILATEDTLRTQGSFSLRQSDYGVRRLS